MLKMLAKFQNVERLTFGGKVLQALSRAELCGVPFPAFKVQTLIVKTKLDQSVIPGITRLLQISTGLKKLIVHTNPILNDSKTIEDKNFERYLNSQGFDPDKYWRSKHKRFPSSNDICRVFPCKDAMSKLLVSLTQLVLGNTKTLDTMVVWLGDAYSDDAKWFEEQLQMVRTISYDRNVSIVLKRQGRP